MPPSSREPYESEARRRARQQLDLIREAVGADNVTWDTDRPEDFNYLFVPGRVLVDRDAFDRAAAGRDADAPALPSLGEPETRGLPEGLESYLVPEANDTRKQDVLDTVRSFDNLLGKGIVTPEHYVHLAIGDGRACPATEPEETGRTQAWPTKNTDPGAGKGVHVHVVDTGWMGAGPVTRPLAPYAGHGSFAVAVVKSRAPGARVTHSEFPINGGAILETDLADRLREALTRPKPPQVISMSAGCHTRKNRPLQAFQRLWRDHLRGNPNSVVVCAAGNDCSPRPFYPAASKWAIGVGSLDHDGTVSSFSNYVDSANVFVLGRNHVNRFPRGTYQCQESPDLQDYRVFRTGWARWSGTSFATPLLSGLIAVHIKRTGRSPKDAAHHLMRTMGHWEHEALYDDYRVIDIDDIVAY